MKRDMNLIRLILLETEGEVPKPDLSAYTEDQRVYHSALLIEAGLIDGKIFPNCHRPTRWHCPVEANLGRHQFLDAARNDTIWHKAGERIKKSGVDVTISLLKEILNQLLKQLLNLP